MELVVVVAIMAIMLSLAANVMRNSNQGQGLQDAVQTLADMVRNARLEAKGKATWARVVVVSDPTDTSNNTKNLRYIAVMVKEPVRMSRSTDPDKGEWKIIPGAKYLTGGFYVSPKYSTLVSSPTYSDDVGMSRSSTFAQQLDKMQMGNPSLPKQDVYFIEFDPQGRMSEPSRPTRLVVISAMSDPNSNGEDAGIRPNPIDKDGLPASAGGIVIWPKGTVSFLRDREQIFAD